MVRLNAAKTAFYFYAYLLSRKTNITKDGHFLFFIDFYLCRSKIFFLLIFFAAILINYYVIHPRCFIFRDLACKLLSSNKPWWMTAEVGKELHTRIFELYDIFHANSQLIILSCHLIRICSSLRCWLCKIFSPVKKIIS